MNNFYLENDIWDTTDYFNYLGLEPKSVTLEEFEQIMENYTEENDESLWDYPLEEMEYCVNEIGGNFVIVRFNDYIHGYEYRICQLPTEE